MFFVYLQHSGGHRKPLDFKKIQCCNSELHGLAFDDRTGSERFSINAGTPIAGRFRMENPTKMSKIDNLGVPLF